MKKLKHPKKHTPSSQRWLTRQLNDPYVVKAKQAGYRSRAAFKLVQLDEKHKILKPGQCVVDLGAAPGGWTQVAVARTKADKGTGQVVGIDLLPVDAVEGAELIQGDFTEEADYLKLKSLLKGPVDVVLSDMAANTTGHTKTDHLRIIVLAEMAYDFAKETLSPGGSLVMKLFQGGETGVLITELKKSFREVKHAKPDASRKDSSELYVVCKGFRTT